jgi:hypothetical protein
VARRIINEFQLSIHDLEFPGCRDVSSTSKVKPLPAQQWPKGAGIEQVVVEMDAGMVPIVEPRESAGERRKGKQ